MWLWPELPLPPAVSRFLPPVEGSPRERRAPRPVNPPGWPESAESWAAEWP